MDEAVEAAVINDPREHIILEAARPQGIPTMVEDGIEKVIAGLTSLDELEHVVELPYNKIEQTNLNTKPPADKSAGDDDFLSHVV